MSTLHPIAFTSLLVRAPDDSIVAAAPTASDPSGAATAAAGAAPPETAPIAPAATATTPWWHEGIPDHMRGADEKATFAALAKAYAGARTELAKSGEVPKDVSGYAFTPSEKVAPYLTGLDQDPFWATTKDLALKHGLSTSKFQGLFGDILEAMVDKSMVAEPFDVEAERAALVPEVADPKQRAAAADRIVRENLATVKAWGEQGLDPGAVKALEATLDRAATNRLVQWIRDRSGEQAPATGGLSPDAVTETDLDRRSADPRNQVGGPKYDPSYARETDRLYRAFYGE